MRPNLAGLLAIFVLTAIDLPASAGGALLREFGTADVALAGAGRGARAQDSSTTFFNPAGMSSLDHSEILGAFQSSMGDIEFDLSRSSNTGGDVTGIHSSRKNSVGFNRVILFFGHRIIS